MPKNIVVCCDDSFNAAASNVVRLYATLKRDAPQVTFFYPGLSMRPVSFSRNATYLLEFAFGTGVFDELRTAYEFLIDRYEPGDRLFLFGAGRGAYTVRMLAGILHLVGLLHRGNEALVPYV